VGGVEVAGAGIEAMVESQIAAIGLLSRSICMS
jgi:hypothetical protein